MKYIVLSLFFASLCSFGMVTASGKASVDNGEMYGQTLSHLLLGRQSVVSGFVFESERGIAITTNRGTFLLKGAAGEMLVGKNVWVTGVIRGESIFAVKIEVRS